MPGHHLRDRFVPTVIAITAAVGLSAAGMASGASASGPITRLGPATRTAASAVFELSTDEGAVAREVARRARATRAGRATAPMTLAQVAARFGAASGEMELVRDWAAGHGLAAQPNAAHTHVMVRGSAAALGRALGVPLSRYRRAGGRIYVAAKQHPAVPRALRGVVDAVVGLDHSLPPLPTSRHTRATHATSNGLLGAAWNCATARYADVKAFSGYFPATPFGTVGPYGYPAVGASTRSPSQLVVAGLAGVGHVPNQADFATYVAACRFDAGPSPSLTSVGVGDTGPVQLPQQPAGNTAEAQMDVSVLGAVVPPNAQVAFYGGSGDADHPTADLLNALIARAAVPVTPATPRLTVVSLSIVNQETPGYGDGEAGNDKLLARLGLMGVSVLAASGDWGSQGAPANEGDGSWSCANTGLVSVNWPASSPFVTGVGGTMWTDPQRPLASEDAWQEGTGCGQSASGGGQSMWYPVPTWQQQPSVPGSNGRNVPDISMLAGPPGLIRRASDQWGWSGGTSAASPFAAAGIARLNADRMAAGKQPLGFLNPVLYGLSPSAFNDISVGTNDLWGVGCCTAGMGYDMVTGLGSPVLSDPSWSSLP